MRGIRKLLLVSATVVFSVGFLGGCGGGVAPAPSAGSGPAASAARSASGMATMVEGGVEIRIPGAAWRALAVKDPVPVGAQVRTAADGMCDLLLATKCAVRLKAGTTVTVKENRVEAGAQKIELDLTAGRLLHRFDEMPPNSEYRLSSPTAGAVIRGTRFEARAAAEAMRVSVLSGLVELANERGKVTVAEKQGATARAGEAPGTPSELVRAELDALNECSLLNFVALIRQVRRVADIAQMRNLQPALEAYAASHDGKYPATLAAAGLGASTDEWNTPFRYEVRNNGTAYTIKSNGPDKAPNTDDDMEFRRD